jgi:Cu(I)/Ag(I) efflux system membrane protein CusA/SilA
MLGTVNTAGLLPIMWSRGTGGNVMKRIAALMVGGVVTAVVVVLVVYPPIQYIWRGRRLKKSPERSAHAET